MRPEPHRARDRSERRKRAEEGERLLNQRVAPPEPVNLSLAELQAWADKERKVNR